MLCWECRERWGDHLTDKSNLDRLLEVDKPWLHCHHEPKEKAKCWCEGDRALLYAKSITTICGNAVEINFCPQCGKKL